MSVTQQAFAPPCLLKRLPTPLCALLGSRPGLMIADGEQSRALGGSRPRETEATLTRLHDADVKDRTPGGNGSPSLPPTLKQQAVVAATGNYRKAQRRNKMPRPRPGAGWPLGLFSSNLGLNPFAREGGRPRLVWQSQPPCNLFPHTCTVHICLLSEPSRSYVLVPSKAYLCWRTSCMLRPLGTVRLLPGV